MLLTVKQVSHDLVAGLFGFGCRLVLRPRVLVVLVWVLLFAFGWLFGWLVLFAGLLQRLLCSSKSVGRLLLLLGGLVQVALLQGLLGVLLRVAGLLQFLLGLLDLV